MSDHETSAPGTAPARVSAVAFPSTDRGLRRLGSCFSTTYMHLYFFVTADRMRFELIGRRSSEPFAIIPVETVRSIGVGETESGSWNREVTLVVFLNVDSPKGVIKLPIVPTGDDDWRRLTWQDAAVRSLAKRLAEASGVELVGPPKRVRRSLPDWTLDV